MGLYRPWKLRTSLQWGHHTQLPQTPTLHNSKFFLKMVWLRCSQIKPQSNVLVQMARGPARPHPLCCPVLSRPPGPPGPLSEESSSEQPSEPLTAHGEAASRSLSGQAPSGQCGKAQCASAWWENLSGGRFCKVDGRHTAQTELGRQCGDSKRWALTGGQAGVHQKRQPAT